jgi:orotidine-5'-phosphate decarboxylase
MPEPFADRLAAAIQQKGSPCCVGLDPRLDWLPSELTARARLRPTPVAVADVVIEFHRRILARIAPIVPAIKPQLAFFEQLGSAGIAAYEDLVVRAHELGLLVIADAKRGDIGPTADAYARAFLGGVAFHGADLSPPAADALTIQPYFGTDGVEPFLEACARTGGGLFVLVRTSNPSSSELQSLRCGEHTLAEEAARLVDRWGSSFVGKSGWSSVGAVVGATHKKELAGLRAAMPRTPFLLPGYGAQGGKADDVVDAFDARGRGGLVVAARSVNFAYREKDREHQDWEDRIERAARAMASDVAAALGRAGKAPAR